MIQVLIKTAFIILYLLFIQFFGGIKFLILSSLLGSFLKAYQIRNNLVKTLLQQQSLFVVSMGMSKLSFLCQSNAKELFSIEICFDKNGMYAHSKTTSINHHIFIDVQATRVSQKYTNNKRERDSGCRKRKKQPQNCDAFKLVRNPCGVL